MRRAGHGARGLAAAARAGGVASAERAPRRRRPRLLRAPTSSVSKSSRSASDPTRPARAAYAAAEPDCMRSPAALATARARAPRVLPRPFDWLRSAPISRSPKAPGTLATSRGLPAPPPPPRHRSLPPHAAASAAAPRAPHHHTASKNEGVGKSPGPPSARGPLQLCFSNTAPFEKFSNSYLIVGAAVVRAF